MKLWSTVAVLLSRDGSGYERLGNVIEHQYIPARDTAERIAAEKGCFVVNDELLTTAKESWEFIVDEEDVASAEWLWLAKWADGVAQSAQTGAQVPLTGVMPGRWYNLAARRVSDVLAELAGVPLQPGQDYLADEYAGLVQVLPGGAIGPGDDVDLTFDRAAATYQESTGPSVRCRARAWIVEWGQDDAVPARQVRFLAAVHAEPLDGRHMRMWRIRLTALDRPQIVLRRQQAWDDCAYPFSIIGAGSDTFGCYDPGSHETMSGGSGWAGPWAFVQAGYYGASDDWESYAIGAHSSGQLAGGIGWSGAWIFITG